MSLDQDLDRGARAERLLTDPFIQDAFDTVAKAIHEQWANCPVRDKEGAHELRLMLKLLGDVRGVFEVAVSDGKLAKQELERLNKKVLSPAQWSGR